jgi:hypothetical protein
MPSKGLLAVTSLLFFSLAGMASPPAYAAGLDGSTVSAAFWLPAPGVTPPTNPPPTVCTTTLACEVHNYIDGLCN